MTKPKAELTEMEGQLLSELSRGGANTAYRMRVRIADSPAADWSGSTGAVYPALKRLEKSGFIVGRTRAGDGRGSVVYELTEAGRDALSAWATDVERATGVGHDPFRLRAEVWADLSEDQRAQLKEKLAAIIKQKLEALDTDVSKRELADQLRVALERELHEFRLKWIDEEFDE